MKLEDPVQTCFFFNDYMCLMFFSHNKINDFEILKRKKFSLIEKNPDSINIKTCSF